MSTGRHQAAGGWRRAVVGMAVGAIVGLAMRALLPREKNAASRPT